MSTSGNVVLRGGTIIDGAGSPAFRGDVVVQDGRILSVGDRGRSSALDYGTIDCSGCIVAPGFIDAHSHSDLQVLENRREKLLQGVTSKPLLTQVWWFNL